DVVLKAQQSRVAIPRRFSVPMRELLMLQPRFNRRSGIKSLGLLHHPRFRAAYDFLLLRVRVGAAEPEVADWWTEIQSLPQEERVRRVQTRASTAEPDGTGGAAPRRRRRRGRRSGSPPPAAP
ncbi:MAG TPA: polynucleotide adenylyltransferase PcnB, partial [Steroidobacteraceae bacterium]|nr:polynucleotide adenylyltransferase PcnB [Steroidobacteraceae bacterium]